MEPCPNCGTPAREGAKFCTTCGYRLAPDTDTAVTNDDQTEENAVATAWAEATPATTTAAEPDIEALAASAWPDAPTESWPAPPPAVTAAPNPWQPPQSDAAPLETAVTNTSADTIDVGAALLRAERLLSQFQETLAEIGRASTADLSGVISELEVAVTPPGALAADDLSELRDALLAARDRPRDVDTIVDLTRRVDAMVTLVIAYDRTVAAIERSLDVLRRQ